MGSTLINMSMDESEGYLRVIQGIEKALLNPRIKNRRVEAATIDRIRQQCASAIETSVSIHEGNKASHRRLIDDWRRLR